MEKCCIYDYSYFQVNENNGLQSTNINNQSKEQFTITKFSKNDRNEEIHETMIETQEVITVSTDIDGKLIEIIESNEDTMMVEDSEDLDIDNHQHQTNVNLEKVIFRFITHKINEAIYIFCIINIFFTYMEEK